MTKKLFKFYWNCGRMGDLDGLFVATQEEVDKVIGKEVYFGEVLGKHSDISGTLEVGDLTIIDVDDKAVEAIVAVTGATISGYNPLDYYEWQEEDRIESGYYDNE